MPPLASSVKVSRQRREPHSTTLVGRYLKTRCSRTSTDDRHMIDKAGSTPPESTSWLLLTDSGDSWADTRTMGQTDGVGTTRLSIKEQSIARTT